MVRAVHRPQVVILAVDIERRVHAFAVIGQVARAVIERFLGDVRRGDAAIAVLALFLQRQEFQLLADHHAVGHPERQAGADIGREGEELQLAAELAMVALFRFLQPVQIGVQFLLVAPGGAVDALQLRVLGVAAPIGAGDLGQLERIADLRRWCENAARGRGRASRHASRSRHPRPAGMLSISSAL